MGEAPAKRTPKRRKAREIERRGGRVDETETRPRAEGDYARDAGAEPELEELERTKRDLRRLLEGPPPGPRSRAEE